MNFNVFSAIFRRNFVAYFSNPTGYVFIGAFMVVCSYFAFWQAEFFNANLANLDQLSKVMPFVLLFYVPTITMSVWADERRQGTDELLLTIPASDLDVVLGKYFAALAIFSVSLGVSLAVDLLMLLRMGEPDIGLYFATCFGYWLMGMAMLAIGMVGSYLTSNVTMAFVWGTALNVPLVVLETADNYVSDTALASALKRWSLAARLEDFSRGVISMSSLIYFVAIAAAMLYICMILIGRRHWMGGRDGSSMLGHYLVRGFALAVIAACAVFFLSNYDGRADATSARLNSLTQDTRKLLSTLHDDEKKELAEQQKTLEKELAEKKKAAEAKKDDKDAKKEVEKAEQRLRQLKIEASRIEEPIVVEAFISRDVPEAYAAKRLDLISKLREMESIAGGKLKVTMYDIDPTSALAQRAKDRHGINARRVPSETRGQFVTDEVYLGAAIASGLNEVVIEFFELGIPVEYELIQAIVTVSQTKRETLGVVKTDADLMGGTLNWAGGMPSSTDQKPIIRELKKHYNVVAVNPSEKIVDPDNPNAQKYDALLVAQPSSLGPAELANLMDAIRVGTPTALFEDPFPAWLREVPGTDEPKRPSPMMGMMPPQRPEEKGEIDQLFNMLGVRLVGERFAPSDDEPALSRGGDRDYESLVVWQRYNPYPKLRLNQNLTSEWVFLNQQSPVSNPKDALPFFADDPITKGLYELLYLFPGAIVERPAKHPGIKFTPLVRTGDTSGTIRIRHIREALGKGTPFAMREREELKSAQYCLAARIQGAGDEAPLAAKSDDPKAKPAPNTKWSFNVILVSDVDMLAGEFFELRANPDAAAPGLELNFQNVPFVLNVIDSLAGDERFMEIRKGRQTYGRLSHVEKRIEQEVTRTIDTQIDEAEKKFKAAENDAEKTRKEIVKDAQKSLDESKTKGSLTISEIKTLEDSVNIKSRRASEQEEIKKVQAVLDLKKSRDEAIEDGKRQTYKLNDSYKREALLLPPLLPLAIGLIVFFYRRSREQEGVAKSRLR